MFYGKQIKELYWRTDKLKEISDNNEKLFKLLQEYIEKDQENPDAMDMMEKVSQAISDISIHRDVVRICKNKVIDMEDKVEEFHTRCSKAERQIEFLMDAIGVHPREVK
jgi:hypothetical protein